MVHNGVNLPGKLPSVAKEKVFSVIYLSVLAKDKGIEDAILAFNLLKAQVSNIKFWVVGKGSREYKDYLRDLCPEAKFWGFVSESLKFKLLSIF